MPDKLIYYRLIALWVVSEAMLGGIIHGLKLPVSGFFVGGMAVIIISMIGYFYPVKGAIIKATIIVAIFKMMLSPHSPAPAYIAVFFQGIIGQLIFLNNKSFRLKCFLFAILALVESGIQRLLVMTLIFGMDIWKAINIFINGITGQESVTDYSYYLAAGYVLLHLIAGFIIGWYSGSIPYRMMTQNNSTLRIEASPDAIPVITLARKKKRRSKILFTFWVLLALLFIHAFIFPSEALIPANLIVNLILRSGLIILTWIVIINPILIRMIHHWLEKKKTQAGKDLQLVTNLLPATHHLVKKSWELSASKKGLKRLPLFLRIVVFNTLIHEA